MLPVMVISLLAELEGSIKNLCILSATLDSKLTFEAHLHEDVLKHHPRVCTEGDG